MVTARNIIHHTLSVIVHHITESYSPWVSVPLLSLWCELVY